MPNDSDLVGAACMRHNARSAAGKDGWGPAEIHPAGTWLGLDTEKPRKIHGRSKVDAHDEPEPLDVLLDVLPNEAGICGQRRPQLGHGSLGGGNESVRVRMGGVGCFR